MIQRIQTVYFIVAAFIQTLLIWIPYGFYSLESSYVKMTLLGGQWHKPEGVSFISPDVAVALTGAFVILCSFASLLLYKNRKLQMKIGWLCILVAVLETLLMVNVLFNGQGKIFTELSYVLSPLKSIGLIFPVLAAVSLFLAIRAIKKDENLVRSIDRIR
ncbi:MAG: DUF4293 domain-containing protein [Flavobacteriales bacterium]|nr:DUF4293 domain-containing protein [Flavobacteriales bacterium]